MPEKRENKNETSSQISKQSCHHWWLLPVLLIAIILTGLAWSMSLLQPVDPDNQEIVRFVVPKGASIRQIGQTLEEKNLIKSSLAFKLYLRLNPDENQVQAGSFELSPSMTIATIIQTLNEGTDDIWVTIPEGLRREEIANSFTQYQLDLYQKEEFLSQTVGMEGQLFPDTYLVPKESEAQTLVSLMQNTFEQKIEPLREEIDSSTHTFNELLVMASLLEREARSLQQMKLVSGVLWKRLELGMPLQVDATLQYAKGYNEQLDTWWGQPLAADKEIESRFNTYRNPGLPPHPICNPGLDAITATLRPIATDNLYYIHDRQGEIHFAQTLEQHNRNVQQYLR